MVSSTMYRILCEVDHKTRSSLRLVLTISRGEISCWSRLTSIFQFQGASNVLEAILSNGFFESCIACTKAVVCQLMGESALVAVLFTSSISASCHGTWLCLQHPRVRLIFQLVRKYLWVADVWQNWHAGSSPSHWFWLLGVRSTLCVVLMMKLSLEPSISQRSFHLSFHGKCSRFSHFVYCGTTWLTSATTSFLFWMGIALCHMGLFTTRPRLPSQIWT